MYDYPLYSKILEKFVAPDMEQVAHALARKYAWRIQPSGETALNYLGLSNQIESKYLYFSDGKSKKYDILGQELEFKHHAFRNAAISDTNTILVIQAIKAIGEENITPDFLQNLSAKFSASEWLKIQKSGAHTTEWVYQIISNIVNELSINND